jgi:hypothetical protein
MHEKVYRRLFSAKEKDLKKQREEENKRLQEEAKNKKKEMKKNKSQKDLDAEQKKAKEDAEEFKAPPFIGFGFRVIKGVKLDIKKIHIRYEDDYFHNNRPFALGFIIDQISLDNSKVHWRFNDLYDTQLTLQEPINKSATLKELHVKNIRTYFNSMSEMFVPTSLWEQTKNEPLEIFSAVDASFI